MFIFRRLVPIVCVVLFAGVLAAAERTYSGVVDKVDTKTRAVLLKDFKEVKESKDGKEPKGKVATYYLTDKVELTDDKGNKIDVKDAQKLEGKEVTVTLNEAVKNNKIEATIVAIKIGKPDEKRAGKGEEKTAKRDAKREDKKDAAMSKNDPSKANKPSDYTVVSADAAKGEIAVEAGASKLTIKVDANTKFIGPRGGDRGEGVAAMTAEDNKDLLTAGYKIKVVMEKGKVKEIHLPYANSLKDKDK
ncbi:hypothetical protein KIH39_24925 [Telmatocola sphagniphila]|uniref:Uncharacterized protein n=1 Tax=Telmatocola sphagniphila TaxID=1123043 RepID=A0A8E6B4K1_9BACT|nr:hypothetical protein [Telmatocola sphagniphila]QVL32040.1 hypothetical protein KIH39_24925 [Telmatocola sphagniphila]